METIKVTPVPRTGWVPFLILLLLNLGFWIAIPFVPSGKAGRPPSPELVSMCWIIGSFWLLAIILSIRLRLKLQGLGAFVDEHGVGALADDKQVWRLDWTNFGGAD